MVPPCDALTESSAMSADVRTTSVGCALAWLGVATVLALSAPTSARAQAAAAPEAEPPATPEPEAEPPVGTWAVLTPPPEPESPPGPSRYWLAADVTYAEGPGKLDTDRMRAGRFSFDARGLATPRLEVAFRWAFGYVGMVDDPSPPPVGRRFVLGNPGLALTYLRRLPWVELRLGGEFVIGLKGTHNPSDDEDARRFLRAIDGLQEGWRFAASATTLVLEASLDSRRGPVHVGAYAAYAIFLGPVARVFVAARLGKVELGLRVGGGLLGFGYRHDGGLTYGPGFDDAGAGIAVTPYLRVERPGFFFELRVTYADLGTVVLSTGGSAGAIF
jgi:hypothetical protein